MVSDDIYRTGVENYSAPGTVYSELLNDNVYSSAVQLGALHNWSVAYRKSIIEFRNLLNQTGISKITNVMG